MSTEYRSFGMAAFGWVFTVLLSSGCASSSIAGNREPATSGQSQNNEQSLFTSRDQRLLTCYVAVLVKSVIARDSAVREDLEEAGYTIERSVEHFNKEVGLLLRRDELIGLGSYNVNNYLRFEQLPILRRIFKTSTVDQIEFQGCYVTSLLKNFPDL